MNRCLPSLKNSPLRLAALLIGLGSLCSTGFAQVRQFPAAALRGTLEVTMPPQILINGKSERLSPGARIKGTNNLLVLSGTLVGQRLLVNYLRDNQGQVHEVWLLTAQEAQEKRAGMETQTNIVFASDADQTKN